MKEGRMADDLVFMWGLKRVKVVGVLSESWLHAGSKTFVTWYIVNCNRIWVETT